jgi:hypothetical protein
MRRSLLGLALTVLLCAPALAHDHPAPPPMPKSFDVLKKLVGNWEGTGKGGDGKETKASAVYELTSGGTALLQKLGPGSPHEMVSVYHKEGTGLGMTHYCALGNAPHMTLKKSDEKSVAFEMAAPQGISSPKEPHMHAVTITWVDADHVREEWTHFADGVKKDSMVFTWSRKK